MSYNYTTSNNDLDHTVVKREEIKQENSLADVNKNNNVIAADDNSL
ncbi:hypothetical protein N752_28185 [Desulforamulus aquiferis]|nr:hypothetical protein N752_28185 [Desulforamulus aquiferis]